MLIINRKKRHFILKKKQVKREQYSHRNNVDISSISNNIPEDDLENKGVNICEDSGVEIDQKDTEGSHRLSLPRNRREQDKRVSAKCLNRKHSKPLLREKNG